jgi:hypothetical protein
MVISTHTTHRLACQRTLRPCLATGSPRCPGSFLEDGLADFVDLAGKRPHTLLQDA